MTLLGVRWFSGQQCVGIVRCVLESRDICYYVGSVSGLDEAVDTEHIMAWGADFPNDAGDLLFGIGNADST